MSDKSHKTDIHEYLTGGYAVVESHTPPFGGRTLYTFENLSVNF
jgi:hypothetical protein